ncbi:MAG: hypothetical protein OXH00_25635 [Candidatus Poribacteria bacterium]|nr:hypothetical protein [Candidatus Poribacteria bacterium]
MGRTKKGAIDFGLIHESRVYIPNLRTAFINEKTDTVGFVGASSIERFACEESIPRVTASFKE